MVPNIFVLSFFEGDNENISLEYSSHTSKVLEHSSHTSTVGTNREHMGFIFLSEQSIHDYLVALPTRLSPQHRTAKSSDKQLINSKSPLPSPRDLPRTLFARHVEHICGTVPLYADDENEAKVSPGDILTMRATFACVTCGSHLR